MIPKIIHYCWFGMSPMPKHLCDYIAEWQNKCGDYIIMRWDETNFNPDLYRYSSEAYKIQEWAFVSDVARLHALYQYGGIYLDTDVEIVKSLDPLLDLEAFVGAEDVYDLNTGAIVGAIKGNDFILENLNRYRNLPFVINGVINKITCVEITTSILRKYGFRKAKKVNVYNNVTVFPSEYFSPLKLTNGKLKITENTYTIHWYTTNWKKRSNLRKWIVRRTVPIKKFSRRNIDCIFGDGTYSRIKYFKNAMKKR